MVITSDPLLRTIQNALIARKSVLLAKYSRYQNIEKHNEKDRIAVEIGRVELLLAGCDMSLEKNNNTVGNIKCKEYERLG